MPSSFSRASVVLMCRFLSMISFRAGRYHRNIGLAKGQCSRQLIGGAFAAEELFKIVHGPHAHGNAGVAGRTSKMRQQKYVFEFAKPGVDIGLVAINVEPG